MERPARLHSLDLVRGLVMVIMALDHSRDFFGDPRVDPTNLDNTTPLLFFTRWVTHFCAPVFVFLAGTSAFLYRDRAQLGRAQLSLFLISRGLWLLLLEFTVVGAGWISDMAMTFSFFQVIGAIGVAMIALAALIWLPRGAILAVGLLIVMGHNLLDPIDPANLGSWALPWTLLHEGPTGPPLVLGGHVFFVQYPILPWIGVMALGYGLGPLLLSPQAERRRALLKLGLVVCAFWLCMRWIGLYGDPQPWIRDGNLTMSLLSFFNLQKYPPSLLYLSMTLGPMLLLLSWLDRKPGPLGQKLIVFGRVPLFYYILHLYVIQYASGLLSWIRDGEFVLTMRAMFASFIPPIQPLPENFGNRNDLLTIYVGWVLVVLMLYPACRWYGKFKAGARSKLWSYL